MKWKNLQSINKAFIESIEAVDDRYRSNGVCVIEKCLIRRLPYKLETRMHESDPFLHFFSFLLHLIQSMPGWLVDMEKYFESYPE
jgi:hypothetical protein